MHPPRLLGSVTFAIALCLGRSALAIRADVTTRDSSLVGEAFTFRATATESSGTTQYRWNFGDGAKTELDAAGAEVSHVYAEPGRYNVLLTVQDSAGYDSSGFLHTVHYPLTEKPPNVSTSIVYDAARKRVYSVNQDNASVSAIDAETLMQVAELSVYERPEALALAPNGKLWVVHRDDYAIAIVDLEQMAIERGFRLPYASQPMGIAFSPTGDAAYVSLMALGQLLKLDPMTGAVVATLDVGPMPRGVSVSFDGKDVYVTRFISPTSGGEVVHVDAAAFTVAQRLALAPDTTTPDSDQGGRGLPNYLFSIGISPDGRDAWIPGKKDNIFRGSFRDQQAMNQDNTVRPMVAVLDLLRGSEALERRIDLDDRSLPIHVAFSPLGEYGFVTLAGTNMIEIRDAYTGVVATSINDTGLSPRASLLDPQNHLFVQAALGRSVTVFDLNPLIMTADSGTPIKLAEIATVANDKTDPVVLQGKRLFNSAADSRMTPQGYLTCAVCHFDGFEDGRIFDFTSRGEGLRNTTSLLGRRGTGQGRVHWSGNFDEIQDFELEIRELFSGHGFMPDDVLAVGTRKDPLGDPKAGLSPELDALAAYLKSLDHVDPSPFRNPDGSMTEAGVAGRALFGKLGCGFCHVGSDFTDSSRGRLHDVGTLLPSSGSRSGQPLLGIDTPTLLGIWETAPYLHDGSAATLRDVLVTKNPNDEHGFVSSLQPVEVDQLVAYLQQIDNELPQHRLPFEPPLPERSGAGGIGGSGQGAGAQAGQVMAGAPNDGSASAPQAPGCAVAAPCSSAPTQHWMAFLAVFWFTSAQGRRRSKRTSASN